MSGWHRTSAHSRGYGWQWQQLRFQVLERDKYLCQCDECTRTGCPRLAHEVDHIVSRAKGGDDRLENLQAINRECHKRKTMRENGCEPVVRYGVDGFPLGTSS